MNDQSCSFALRLGSRCSHFLPAVVFSLAALYLAGCGGSSGKGTGATFSGNTTVVLFASSTANDQLSSFSLTIKSLT
ncbi:MAG: hypothetical protein WBC92_10485, partial [Terracidiphilus sp.]